MTRALLMGCALALALPACTESQSQCLAACSNSLEVMLLQEGWADGEHTLVARYDARRTARVATCTFTLPGGEDAACEDYPGEAYGPELSIDATVTLSLAGDPDRIALELHSPGGTMKSLELVPAYERYEVCSNVCRNGSATGSFDEEGP